MKGFKPFKRSVINKFFAKKKKEIEKSKTLRYTYNQTNHHRIFRRSEKE